MLFTTNLNEKPKLNFYNLKHVIPAITQTHETKLNHTRRSNTKLLSSNERIKYKTTSKCLNRRLLLSGIFK